jgi:hypothetical protein
MEKNPIPKQWYPRIAWGLVVAFVLIITIWVVSTWIGVINEGNKWEAQLSAQYANGANVLSQCVVQTEQAADAVGVERDALIEILSAAVSGRYNSESSASVDNGKLFSAIVEAYPDTTGIDQNFGEVIAIIKGCRDNYANQQARVLGLTDEFNAWRTGTLRVRMFGGSFPNDNLYIQLPNGTRITGLGALERMEAPVIDEETLDAYINGVFETENPFDNN